ncbi:hypothetical protein GGS26DRAFT_100816 [Hypomontagnella submonticulosa]|nr:hypothetical protein GGS26DRAFT_100816 [Hypomontagnella submonticulosa]
MRISTLTVATALALASGGDAARACTSSSTTPSTYQWHLGAARYDGAEPGESNGPATVALSIVPGTSTMGTFFECVAEWPESWEGFYEDGNIIWSDCIWAGNGQTYDTAVAFAMDWKNRTLYISHTYDCSDQQGSNALATGSVHLDMDCATNTDNSTSCMLKGDGASITTTGALARAQTDTCEDNTQRYQSWQLENWRRKYEMVPGSPDATPLTDSGPSFTLRNMANTDVFNCSTNGNQRETIDGTCQLTSEGNITTIAWFRFEPRRDVIVISQRWYCPDSGIFDTNGVGYVQATCSREGNVLSCSSNPIWIGTKTL